jgi:uncharacterized protein (DUF736 family)
MAKLKIGSAWDKQANGKKYISVELDLGVLGDVSCAVFEDTKRDASRKQPTHNLIHTPEGGKAQYVGAFWAKTAKRSGQEYLMGKLQLSKLGVMSFGAATVDFSKLDLPIEAKICRVTSTAEDKKAPQYIVLKVVRDAKAPVAGGEEE